MVLVTGGGGVLGLNLARDLAERGEQVLLLSWIHEGRKTEVPSFLVQYWGKEVTEVMGDVLEWPSILDVMAKHPVDSIVHAAGTWPGRPGETSLYHVASVDVTGTLNILEAARIFNVRRITFISSLGVYIGLPNNTKVHEDINLPAMVPDVISSTKKAAEQLAMLLDNLQHGYTRYPGSEDLRPCSHWGIKPLEKMVVNTLQGIPADCLETYERSYVCPIYTKDYTRGIITIHLADKLKYNVYNLSDGNCVAYREVAEMVREVIPGADIRLATTEQGDVSFPFQLDISRIKDEGWTPRYGDLKAGIRAYADYLMHGIY